MAEYVVSDTHGRPLCVVEAPNIGAVNLAIMRLPSGRGFDGTIRPRAEVEPQITAHEARRVERAKAAWGALGVSEAVAVQGFNESRRSGLDALPRYRIPAGGLPARSGATPSSTETQAAALRERAVKAFDRLDVSETVAVNGL